MQHSNLPKPKPTRLGEPLGTLICAHYGGNAWSLLLEIQKLRNNRVACEIGISFLDESETPPLGCVYLRDTKTVSGVTKFLSRPIVENGITVIDIPPIRAALKPKRIRVNAGMIFATVNLGNNWRDRSGHVHNTTLCAPAQ
ncbi:MAG: hypothetical protein Q7K44_03705 [Candidatus Liptonbacteria bacterium]|nr:hypothetical protein [Candidatus Liptonbacteria bacterium]